MQIFLYLDLVKIKLKLMLNNLVQKKETFFDYKENIKNYNHKFQRLKNRIFPNGLNYPFAQKNEFFPFICFQSKKY